MFNPDLIWCVTLDSFNVIKVKYFVTCLWLAQQSVEEGGVLSVSVTKGEEKREGFFNRKWCHHYPWNKTCYRNSSLHSVNVKYFWSGTCGMMVNYPLMTPGIWGQSHTAFSWFQLISEKSIKHLSQRNQVMCSFSGRLPNRSFSSKKEWKNKETFLYYSVWNMSFYS